MIAASWFLLVRLYWSRDFIKGTAAWVAVTHCEAYLAWAPAHEVEFGATWVRTAVKLTEPMGPSGAVVFELGYGGEAADAVALGAAELGATELDIAEVPPPQVLPLFAACGAEDPREARKNSERYRSCIL